MLLKDISKYDIKQIEAGLNMANCKDPMDVALRIIKQDGRILRVLNNGYDKAQKA